jgi:hypothetical protein
MTDLEFQNYTNFHQNAQWLRFTSFLCLFEKVSKKMEAHVETDLSFPREHGSNVLG